MNKTGFTIIELVLVITIMAALAMIVAPVFQNSIPRIKLYSEARKLMAEIRNVQQEAISSNATYAINFIGGTDTLKISYFDENNNEHFRYSYTLDPSIDLVNTSFTGNNLQFNILGEPSEGGDIVIANNRNESSIIRVAPSTGKVSIIK